MITVTLSREEIQERASALAQYANKLIELEEEEEDIKAGHKSRMARLKERRLEISGEIRRLSRAVRLGVEERSEQRVLFEEERRMEEFRREAEAEAEADAQRAIDLIEQQQQASKQAVGEFFAESDELQSVLSLVFEDPIALEVIDGWTTEQKEQAMKWATAAHLQASDNDIDVPPVPEFLKTSQGAPEEERERVHAGAVARWRRERPASVESGETEEEGEVNPQINEHGVYVKGVEVIKVPFPKKAKKTEVVISLVKDEVDGMWRSAYSATAGVASFTGPICDYDPCHEMREGAIAAAGWKARSFLLRQGDTGGLSDAAKRQVEAAISALDDWLEINARDHSAAYPDDEIEAAPDQADDFTAPRCGECGRIDGAHTRGCSKSNVLTHDDYLAYARAHYKKNHQSHARKMELTRLNDEQVREWKQQQAGKNDSCVCGHIRDWHDGQGGCCMGCLPGECDGFRSNEEEIKQQRAGKEQVRKCNHPDGCENEAREGFGYCEPHRAASVEHAIEVGKKAEAKEKKKREKMSSIEAAIDR